MDFVKNLYLSPLSAHQLDKLDGYLRPPSEIRPQKQVCLKKENKIK
jgi:hypothetical protein